MSQRSSGMRRAYIAVAGAAAVLVGAVIGLSVLRGGPAPDRTPEPTAAVAPPTPSPSPAAVTATPTAPPTPTASPSPTPRPSPTRTGQFVNASMGYAMDLKPPWHRAICGSSVSGGPLENTNGVDMFIPIPNTEFRLGHVGPFSGNSDSIHVFAGANPEGLLLRDWKRSRMGGSTSEQIADTTFLGRPALLIAEGPNETFLFGNAGYVWQVGHRLRTGSTALADRAAIVRSFRFLTADEARATRAAATPSPAPRTPEQVADVLAEGFAKRDVSILARVIRPCVYEGAYQAGPESMDAQTYLEKLRQRSAQGLVVEVRARPISGDPSTTLRIRSTWREPGQPARETDLTMTVDRGTTYWDGTITCVIAPCP